MCMSNAPRTVLEILSSLGWSERHLRTDDEGLLFGVVTHNGVRYVDGGGMTDAPAVLLSDVLPSGATVHAGGREAAVRWVSPRGDAGISVGGRPAQTEYAVLETLVARGWTVST